MRALCAITVRSCIVLELEDSYGDGWNGGAWTWTTSTGDISETGTGSSGTDGICDTSGGCGTLSFSDGSYPTEISWTAEYQGDSYSGGSTETAEICTGPPPSPRPTTAQPSSKPTSKPTATPTIGCGPGSFLNESLQGLGKGDARCVIPPGNLQRRRLKLYRVHRVPRRPGGAR